MKRKVGELFNKPIVQGNENVLSSNEILVEQKGNTFSLKERVNGEIKEVSGGSFSGSGVSSIEYLDVSGVNRHIKQTLLFFSLYSKVPQDIIIDTSEGGNQSTVTFDASIGPSANTSSTLGSLGMSSVHAGTFLSEITALGIDFSQKIVTQGQTMTVNEFFTMSGGKETIDAIPRITEEEFYTL